MLDRITAWLARLTGTKQIDLLVGRIQKIEAQFRQGIEDLDTAVDANARLVEQRRKELAAFEALKRAENTRIAETRALAEKYLQKLQ